MSSGLFLIKDTHVVCISSSSGEKYYITPHSCPHCHEIVWTCTCKDFTMGRASRGIDPFLDPCKHVKDMLAQGRQEGIEEFWKEGRKAAGRPT